MTNFTLAALGATPTFSAEPTVRTTDRKHGPNDWDREVASVASRLGFKSDNPLVAVENLYADGVGFDMRNKSSGFTKNGELKGLRWQRSGTETECGPTEEELLHKATELADADSLSWEEALETAQELLDCVDEACACRANGRYRIRNRPGLTVAQALTNDEDIVGQVPYYNLQRQEEENAGWVFDGEWNNYKPLAYSDLWKHRNYLSRKREHLFARLVAWVERSSLANLKRQGHLPRERYKAAVKAAFAKGRHWVPTQKFSNFQDMSRHTKGKTRFELASWDQLPITKTQLETLEMMIRKRLGKK